MSTNAFPSAREPPGPREQTLEVSVFLFLILPSMVLGLFGTGQGSLSFVLVAVSTILRDVALVALVLFFLWRNGEPLARIGWTSRQAWREVAWGFPLFLALVLGSSAVERLLLQGGLSRPSAPVPQFLSAQGTGQLVLAAVLVAVVAVAEETIFRGYLILRLQAAMGSRVWAVVVSSLAFAVGHGYEGSAGVVTVGLMGAAFAVVYLWRGSLIAPMVMHFLQDFVGIVLAPLVGQR